MVDPIPFTDLYQSGRVTGGVSADGTPLPDQVSLSAIIDLSPGPVAYLVDFTTVNQRFVTGLIKSMFMDNSDNPNEVVITVQGSNQRFTFPPQAQGFVPVTAITSTKILLESDGGGSVQTRVTFYNFDRPAFIWYKYGNNPQGTQQVYGTIAEGLNITAAEDNNPVLIGADKAGLLRRLFMDPNDGLYVAVKDGADITQGAKADAAWNGVTASPSLVSIFKGMFANIASMFAKTINCGPDYENCPAGATTTLGAVGAIGDILSAVIIVPAAAAPGPVSIKDGGGAAIPIFIGGATVTTTAPFTIDLKGIKSAAGAWQLVVGAGVTAIGVGDFT